MESVNQRTNEDNDFYDEGPIEDVANWLNVVVVVKALIKRPILTYNIKVNMLWAMFEIHKVQSK